MTDTQESMESARPEEGTGTALRICVLGPLDIAWEGQDPPFPKERLAGRGAAPSLGLLKALLSQTDRFATRDWLLEQFWPESAMRSAQERLDDVASGLRTLLRLPGSSARILQYVYGSNGKGNGYRLEGYPLIWVDADAFTWYIEQAARFERFGQDALPLWEQAYHLGSRGQFLPEEIYSDWAHARREDLAGQYRQCVHRLTALLRERGAIEQALLRLRTSWQASPTDEDMLRPLMELLGEQERYQEAEDYYQQCTSAVIEENDGQPLDDRTLDLHGFLLAKQLQRKPVTTHTINIRPSHSSTHLLDSPHSIEMHPSSQKTVVFERYTHSNAIETTSSPSLALLPPFDQNDLKLLFEEGMRIVTLVGQKAHWSLEEIHIRIDQLLRKNSNTDLHEQENDPISRRDILLLLTGLPSALMGLDLAERASPLQAEEVVSLCLTTIPACWNLVYAGGIHHVEKVLPHYLASLVDVIQQSSHHRQLAASLASQGYKLANLLALQQEDFSGALQCSKNAFHYGQIAESSNLQVAALIEEALTFWYRKRPVQTLETYQKALHLLKGVSPIIEGRVYVGLAEASAKTGREQEALRYIELAHDTFPANPEHDLHFSYTHYDHYYINLYKGLMYTNLNQPSKALDAYAHFHAPEYAARNAEVANREASVLLALGDLDQCAEKVRTGVTLALSMNSDLRYSEAYAVWQGMMIKWGQERKVKMLASCFVK